MQKKKLAGFSDEKLVKIIRSQDKELYREIVRRYQDKLLRYANYLLKNDHKAQDVVQNSFIKAYKNLFKFDLKRKFSSWIYRIVHNEAINYLKQNKKKVSLETNSNLSLVLASKENIELNLEKKEIKIRVKKCLSSLPIKYKIPLVLFFLEEKSYTEISDILRMPISTIGTRISRGKLLLKKICEKRSKKYGN